MKKTACQNRISSVFMSLMALTVSAQTAYDHAEHFDYIQMHTLKTIVDHQTIKPSFLAEVPQFQSISIQGTWVLDSVINIKLGNNSKATEETTKANKQVILIFHSDGTYKLHEENKVQNGSYLIQDNTIQLIDNHTNEVTAEYNFRTVDSSRLYLGLNMSRCVSRTVYVYKR